MKPLFLVFTWIFISIHGVFALERPESIHSEVRRVVAIGDVHGDFKAAMRAIRIAGIINDKNEWIGGDTIFVQVGDQTDRGDSEKEIIDFLEELRPKALEAGGRVITLNGNHETKNVS